MSDGFNAFVAGMILAGVVVVAVIGIHGHSYDGICARYYGTDTREFALCAYELPRKLRDKP